MKTQNTPKQPCPSPEMAASPTLAATMLAGQLGESESTWTLRLINGRRPERKSPIPWYTNDHGNPVYSLEELREFIGAKLAKRSLDAPAGDGVGQTKATAIADVQDGRAFVKLFLNAGTAQASFSLSPQWAESLAEKLAEAAEKAKHLKTSRVLA